MSEMGTLKGLLRQKRKENGWKNKDVAEMIECHHSLISAYETGRRRPTLHNLKKLAGLYGLDYLSLLQMRENPKEEEQMQKKLYASERKNIKYETALHTIRGLATKDGTMKEIRKIATQILFD